MWQRSQTRALGDIRLIRPDPQIIWPLDKPWGNYDAIYHRSESGGGNWEFKHQLPEHWQIKFAGLQFKIRPTNFKHTGLFPSRRQTGHADGKNPRGRPPSKLP